MSPALLMHTKPKIDVEDGFKMQNITSSREHPVSKLTKVKPFQLDAK